MEAEIRINPYSDLLAVSGLIPASLLRIILEALRPSSSGRHRLPIEVAAGVVHLLQHPDLIPTPEVAVRGLRIKCDDPIQKAAVFDSVQEAAKFLASQDRSALAPWSAAEASKIVGFLAELVSTRTNVQMLKPRLEVGREADVDFATAIRAHDKAAEALTRIRDEISGYEKQAEIDKKAAVARARKAARIVVKRFRKKLRKAATVHFVDGKWRPPTKAEFDLFVVKVDDLWNEAVRKFVKIVELPHGDPDQRSWTESIDQLDRNHMPALNWRQRMGMFLRSAAGSAGVGTVLAAAGAAPAAQFGGYDLGALAVPLSLMPYAGWAGFVAIGAGILWVGWSWLTAGKARRALVDRFVKHFDEKAPDLEKMLGDAYEAMADKALEAANELKAASLAPERKILADIQELAGLMSKVAWASKAASGKGQPGKQSARVA
jgi:hypothetical protein